MPDSIAAWAQQPFLRANVPKKNDLAERQVLLRLAIDRWFETGDIPSRQDGTVKKVDSGTKTVVVKTADGAEHTFHFLGRTIVHGTEATAKGSKDAFQ